MEDLKVRWQFTADMSGTLPLFPSLSSEDTEMPHA